MKDEPVRKRRNITLDVNNAKGYIVVPIRSFANRETERIWKRESSTNLDPRIVRAAQRKLAMLDAAVSLKDLRVPPGNRLELLRGKRSGQHSIRINDQWRICFTWTEKGPMFVEIVDYH